MIMIVKWWRRLSFVAWAVLSFATLVGAMGWFEIQCSEPLLKAVTEALRQCMESPNCATHISPERAIFSPVYYLFIGYGYVLVIVGLFVITLSLRTMWRMLDRHQRAIGVSFGVLLAVLVTIFSLFEQLSDKSCLHKVYFSYWYRPISEIVRHEKVLTLVFTMLSTFAVALLVLAAASLRQDSAKGDLRDSRNLIHRLRDQFSELRRLLYAGATLFTVNILTIHANLLLNIAAVSPSDKANATPNLLGGLVANLTFIYGMAYSAVLFVAFYPTVVALQARAYYLADEFGAANINPNEYLAKHGLDVRPYLRLREFFAILAPLLVGPISTTIDFLKHLSP